MIEATALPPAFSLKTAREAGLTKDRVYDLLDSGAIERIGRGVFLRPDEIDPAYAAIAGATAVQSSATMCLTSALAVHDLTDAIPFGTDIALRRGTRSPAGFDHVVWHTFGAETFDLGRQHVDLGPHMAVAIYSAERTLVDTFRLMHQEGSDTAYEALRRWLRKPGNSPSALLAIAASFPHAQPRLRHALEVLL